ncbi:MAG: RagB/SusD family nutrient uptake outer membrane protein [Balneolaceae bacterium]|nr:RagB/SusD family nutrient uptake outer membrane protein [Balneolaceae bacterium]
MCNKEFKKITGSTVMYRLKFLISIGIIFTIFFTGCTDGLNETPFSSVTEESITFSEEDFNQVIGPVYSNMRGLHGFHNYFTQEITADELAQPGNASGWIDGGKFHRMMLHTWTAEQDHVADLWGTLYQGVLHANRIISGIEGGAVKIPEGENQQSVLSEIKTARAFYYWLILDNFGDAPLVTAPTEGNEMPGKTPRGEIYQFVVDELTNAIPNLSEETNQRMYGRFNKWAAKTLLAAVYLNAEVYTGSAQWDNVIQQTNDVINSGKYMLAMDYSEPFKVQNQNSNENIFVIPYDQINGGGFNIAVISFHASLRDKFQMQSTPWGAGSAQAVPQFGDIYESDDKRLEKTWVRGLQFSHDGDTLKGQWELAGEPLVLSQTMKNGMFTSEMAGWRVGKFEIAEGATGSLSNDFPVFRYARVLMMKAEALLRTGNASQAASLVSDVRSRAFDDPADAQVSAGDLTSDSEYDYGYWEDFRNC